MELQGADKIILGYSINPQSQILLGLLRKFQSPDPRESWLLKLLVKYSNKTELTLSTTSGKWGILFPVQGTCLGHKDVVQ